MLFLAFLHKITQNCNLRDYKTAPFRIITYSRSTKEKRGALTGTHSLNEFKKYSKLWFLSVLSQVAALVAALVARAAVALVASVVVALVAAALA